MPRRAVARILIDEQRPPEPSWCWREEWLHGGESIYCLLGLFEAYNEVTGRRVADAFIEPAPRRRGGRFVESPTVDLRKADRFMLTRFAQATRLPVERVREGFVAETFQASGWHGSTSLRWCPACARSGYHGTIFQLPTVLNCPAHRCSFQTRCPRCRSELPYKLSAAQALPLFTCPQCRLDLIGGVREGTRHPRMEAADAQALADWFALTRFCDRLPLIAAQVCNEGRKLQRPDLVLSKLGPRTHVAAFTAFASQVMTSLRQSPQDDWQTVAPACWYAEPWVPVSRRGKVRAERAKTGWPVQHVPPSDARLVLACVVYRSVRRCLWRHVVRRHRHCIRSAAKRLWWALAGSETPSFCPAAAAFLRWRFQWEAAPVASQLFGPPAYAPLGLVTWLAHAPVAPPSWTQQAESWLLGQALGRDLLTSFRALLHEENARSTGAKIRWGRVPGDSVARSCWLCAGQGTAANPARLFVLAEETQDAVPRSGRGHRRRHTAALATIEH